MSIRYNLLHYSKIIGLILLIILIKLSFKKGNNEEFYPNGQKISSGIFIDGKAEGAWTWWYQNGNKMTEGMFINGKRNGTWSTWYKNSQKKSQATYIDDKLNGSYTSWHENGEGKYKGNYKDDKLDSIQFYYDTLGRLIGKKQFKDGILLLGTSKNLSFDHLILYPSPKGEGQAEFLEMPYLMNPYEFE